MFVKPANILKSGLIAKPSTRKTAERIGYETAQEYAEEVINLVAEEAGRKKGKGEKFTVNDAYNLALTRKGLEAGLLGALGGAGQTAITAGIGNIDSKYYKGKYADQLSQYEKQQEEIAKLQSITESNNVGSLTDVFLNSAAILEKERELAEIQLTATLEGRELTPEENEVIEAGKKTALRYQINNALNNGTLGVLRNQFEKISNFTEEEAEQRGINDPKITNTDPRHYSNRARQAIETIDESVAAHEAAQRYGEQASFVFHNRSARKDLENRITNTNAEIDKLRAEKERNEAEDIPANEAVNSRIASMENRVKAYKSTIRDLERDFKINTSPKLLAKVKARSENDAKVNNLIDSLFKGWKDKTNAQKGKAYDMLQEIDTKYKNQPLSGTTKSRIRKGLEFYKKAARERYAGISKAGKDRWVQDATKARLSNLNPETYMFPEAYKARFFAKTEGTQVPERVGEVTDTGDRDTNRTVLRKVMGLQPITVNEWYNTMAALGDSIGTITNTKGLSEKAKQNMIDAVEAQLDQLQKYSKIEANDRDERARVQATKQELTQNGEVQPSKRPYKTSVSFARQKQPKTVKSWLGNDVYYKGVRGQLKSRKETTTDDKGKETSINKLYVISDVGNQRIEAGEYKSSNKNLSTLGIEPAISYDFNLQGDQLRFTTGPYTGLPMQLLEVNTNANNVPQSFTVQIEGEQAPQTIEHRETALDLAVARMENVLGEIDESIAFAQLNEKLEQAKTEQEKTIDEENTATAATNSEAKQEDAPQDVEDGTVSDAIDGIDDVVTETTKTRNEPEEQGKFTEPDEPNLNETPEAGFDFAEDETFTEPPIVNEDFIEEAPDNRPAINQLLAAKLDIVVSVIERIAKDPDNITPAESNEILDELTRMDAQFNEDSTSEEEGEDVEDVTASMPVANSSHYLYETTNGRLIIGESGKPLYRRGYDGLPIEASRIGNPNFKIGDTVRFLPYASTWFKNQTTDNPSSIIPILVQKEINGEWLNYTILAAKDGDQELRKTIYDNWQNGDSTYGQVLPVQDKNGVQSFSKNVSNRNVNSMSAPDGTKIFLPLSRMFSNQYVATKFDENGIATEFEYSSQAPIYLVGTKANYNPEGFYENVRFDTEGYPEEISKDIFGEAATNTEQDNRGIVFAAVRNPSGKWTPLALRTSQLDPMAVNKVYEMLTSPDLLVPEKVISGFESINSIVYTNNSPIADTPNNTFFLNLIAGTPKDGKARPAIEFHDGNEIVRVELSDLGNDSITATRLRLEKNADNEYKFVNNGIIENYPAEDKIKAILSKKRYNVPKSLMVETGNPYTSPVTGKQYDSYIDYLSSTEEGNDITSIVTSDTYSDKGSFFHTPGMKFGLTDSPEAKPVAEASTDNLAEQVTTKIKDNEGSKDIEDSDIFDAPFSLVEPTIPEGSFTFESTNNKTGKEETYTVNYKDLVLEERDPIKYKKASILSFNLKDSKSGLTIGIIEFLELDKETLQVSISDITWTPDLFTEAEQIAGLGIGTIMYMKAIETVWNRGYKVISDDSDLQSSYAVNIWNKFVGLGIATKEGDNYVVKRPDIPLTGNLAIKNGRVDVQQAAQWMSDRGLDLKIFTEARMVDGKFVHGMFKEGINHLWKYADRGTEYHEAFHNVFRAFLRDTQQTQLLEEARTRYSMADATDIDVEERLAEEFRSYVISNQEPKSILGSIGKFFRDIWNWVTSYVSRQRDIDQVFSNIEANLINKQYQADAKVVNNDDVAYSLKVGIKEPTQQDDFINDISSIFIDKVQAIKDVSPDANIDPDAIFESIRQDFLKNAFTSPTGGSLNIMEASRAFALYNQARKEGKGSKSLEALKKEFKITPKGSILVYLVNGWKDKLSGDDLQNIQEKGWVTLTREGLGRYGYKIITQNAVDTLEDQMDDIDKVWGKSHLTDSHKDQLSGEVKRFLSRIRSSRETLLGNKAYIPFDELYPVVTNAIVGASSYNQMIQGLQETIDANPDVANLLKALEDTPNTFKAGFYNQLALTRTDFIAGIEEVDITDGKKSLQVRFFDPNASNSQSRILNRWINKAFSPSGDGLYIKTIGSSGDVDISVNDAKLAEMKNTLKVVEDIPKFGEPGTKNIEAMAQFLEDIGTDITLEDLNTLLNRGVRVGSEVLRGRDLYNYIYNPAFNKNSRGFVHLIRDAEAGLNIYNTQGEVRKRLVNVKSVLEPAANQAFLNGKGESTYPVNLNTTADRLFQSYKDYDPNWRTKPNVDPHLAERFNLIEKMLEDPYYNPKGGNSMSWFLEGITNKSSLFRDNMRMRTFDVYKQIQEKGFSSNTYDNIGEAVSIITRMNAFFTGGTTMRIAFPTLADRNRMVFMEIPRLSISSKNNHKFYPPDKVKKIIYSNIVQEMQRMAQAAEQIEIDGLPKIKDYHTKSKQGIQFQQFSFLNETKEGKALIAYATGDDIDKWANLYSGEENAVRKNLAAAKSHVESYITYEVNKELDRLKNLSLASDNYQSLAWQGNYGTFNEALRDFITINMITKQEIAKFFTGDPALYKDYVTSSKRAGIIFTPGYETFQSNMIPGSEYGNTPTYTTGIINDVFQDKAQLKDFEALKSFVDAEGKKVIDGYLKGRDGSTNINKTDAQGFTTLEKHRALQQGQDTWTDAHEKAYQNYISMPIGKRKFQYVEKGVTIKPKLSPVKTVHDGLYWDDKFNKVIRIVDKHSTFPLLDDFTKSRPAFKNLQDRMEARGQYSELRVVDEVNMDSSRKVGLYGNVDMSEDLSGMEVVTLNSANQRIPQVIPDNNKPNLWGSQIRKLILANLQNNLGTDYTVGALTMKGNKMISKYHQAAKALIDLSKDELYKELGYVEGSTKREDQLNFLKNLRRLISSAVEDRNLSDNYIKALNIDEIDQMVRYSTPLAQPILQEKFEQIIFSLFRNNLMNQPLNGKAFVQIAELGGVGTTMAESKDLKFVHAKDGKIQSAEIGIPYEIAEEMGIVADDTGELQIPTDVNDRLFELVGYRIPTQGKNSALPLKIKYVLPKAMGKMILVPGAITYQMGSDFDIDKLFLMMPNYDMEYVVGKGDSKGSKYKRLANFFAQVSKYNKKHGTNISVTPTQARRLLSDDTYLQDADFAPEKTLALEFVRNEVVAWENANAVHTPKPSLVEYDVNNLAGSQRAGIENFIIDVTKGILTNKAQLTEMLSSIDSDVISNAAKSLTDLGISPSLELSPDSFHTEVLLEQLNKAGKAGVGMYATALTGAAIGGYSVSAEQNLKLLPAFELILDGKNYSDLSRHQDDTGQFITYNLSERLSESVDNAKNLVMALVNDNAFTYPVINLLLRTGAVNKSLDISKDSANTKWSKKSNNFVVLFTNQPIIKELTYYYNNNNLSPNDLYRAVSEIGSRYRSEYAPQASTKPFTSEDLKNGIEKDILDNVDSQLDMLNNFYHFHRAGRKLSHVNKVFNSDRVSDMSSLSAIEVFKGVQQSVTDRLPDGTISVVAQNIFIAGYEPVLEGNSFPMTKHYLGALDEAVSFAEQFLPFNKPAFRNVKDTIKLRLNRPNLTKEALRAINRASFISLYARRGAPFAPLFNDKYVRKLLTGSNNIAVQYEAIKEYIAKNYPDMTNTFMEKLSPDRNNIKEDVAHYTLSFDYSYSTSKFDTDKTIEDLRRIIYHQDPKIAEFGKNLIYYTILSKGFAPGHNSFIDLIPIEVWEDREISFTEDTMNEWYYNNEPNFDNPLFLGDVFVDEFIKNNVHLSGLVPSIEVDTGIGVIPGIEFFYATEYTKAYSRDLEQYSEYVRIANPRTKKWHLYQHTGDGRYNLTNTLGVPFRLQQYNFEDKARENKTNCKS